MKKKKLFKQARARAATNKRLGWLESEDGFSSPYDEGHLVEEELRPLDERKLEALGLEEIDDELYTAYAKLDAAANRPKDKDAKGKGAKGKGAKGKDAKDEDAKDEDAEDKDAEDNGNKNSDFKLPGHNLVISREGEPGPFDVSFPHGAVFWRGDSRGPKEVLRTGFSGKFERLAGSSPDIPNVIIFRTVQDDIVPASGVCIAGDIRGAAFFPFINSEGTEAKTFYLYAIAVDQATSTYAAQKKVESVETGKPGWKRASRFQYDPDENAPDEASAVWQFREYVVHRVLPSQIIGAWPAERLALVTDGSDSGKGGIRFKLGKDILPTSQQGQILKRWMLRKEALAIADRYKVFYPRSTNVYLSYYGTVQNLDSKLPKTPSSAKVKQLQPVVHGGPRFNPKKQARIEKLALKKELKQRGKQRR